MREEATGAREVKKVCGLGALWKGRMAGAHFVARGTVLARAAPWRRDARNVILVVVFPTLMVFV